ncbi:VWA domain-containing protein [Robertkochia sediminum]|uniref:VWA domain-containing protein n=1 Tax=Robertkochia sediminum TaxID=2785326 RepID=UPI001934B420|nr:VWA domain-containing protein [Robertkochia sediminum]MBL7471895.1 VWA domain-containing protein [Robertkochia sediminum]
MYQLDQHIYFYLLLVIPGLVVMYVLLQLWKRRARKQFGDQNLLRRLSPERSSLKPLLKLILWCLALALLAFALVNPKIGTKLETVKREGVDLVFALDVSKSMAAEDIAPSRLEKAKRITSEIINNLVSDRIGIIAYAAGAYPQLPITTDYAAAKMFLQNMNTDMMSSQGTAIGQAIDLATTYFDDQDQTNRVLIIISDGEDHSGGFEDAVEKALAEGIRIYTIGVGTARGGRIPLRSRGVIQSYKKDSNGDVVITRLNDATLQQIADLGEGGYVNGTNTEEVVEYVSEMLAQMDKKEFEAKQFADFKDQFQWFLGGALLLLFLDVFFLERRTAWLRRLNLFNEKEETP